jgi:TPR repeat protein
MRKILLLMAAAVLAAGCASSGYKQLILPEDVEKVQTAAVDRNDLDAVIRLSKSDIKSFFASKEGIVVLNNSFKRIPINMDADSLYWLANAYGLYPSMIVNGEKRERILLERAYAKKSQDAALVLLVTGLKYGDKQNWQDLTTAAMPMLDTEHLNRLYIKYADLYEDDGVESVIAEIKKRQLPLPDHYYISKFKRSEYTYYKREQTVGDLVNELVAGNDLKKIKRILHALVASDPRSGRDAVALLCRHLLAREPDNPDALYGMGCLYATGSARAGIKRDATTAMDFYVRAVQKGQMDAACKLLAFYGEKKELSSEYFKLKNSLLQSDEGTMAVARYFKTENRLFAQEKLLIPFAEQGNQKAILALAAVDDRHTDSFEVKQQVQHWREYILQYGSKDLKHQFLEEIKNTDSAYGRDYRPESEILSLREAYNRSRRRGETQKMMAALEQAVALQDKRSILRLADICFSGKYGLASSPDKGLRLLSGLAEQGDADALDTLGQYFSMNGYKRFPSVLPMVRHAADNKDENALYLLVDYLMALDHRPEGFTKSEIKTYLSQIGPDPKLAALTLGIAYEKGGVLKKNIALAKANYLKAGDGADGEGYYRLGKLELETADTAAGRKKGLNYLNEAITYGSETAAMELGQVYQKGELVPKDISKAMTYYKMASQSFPEAFRRMGIIFNQQKQYEKALQSFVDGAKAGDAESMWFAGKAMETGRGIEKHPEYALKAYEMAIENGCLAAAYDLGMLYINGAQGVEKDREKGMALLEKAGTQEAKAALARLKEDK